MTIVEKPCARTARAFTILFAITVCAHASSPEAPRTPAPINEAAASVHEARAEQVEKKYRAYAARLEKAHEKLRALLKVDAPDLYRRIKPTPPRPVEYGYQIVPKLVLNSADKDSKRAVSVSYSWSRTEQFIEWELPKINELEEKIGVMFKIEKNERRPIYEKMTRDYPELEANQNTIDNHIQYNRFWQRVIADDRARFDRLTRLHDMAVERQALLDKPTRTFDQEKRQQYLTQQIREQNDSIKPPSFVKVLHPKSNVWVIEVPLYTDIRDKKFIQGFKESVENAWYVEDRENVFKMKLVVREINPYKRKKAAVPRHGEHIDIVKHVEHFPADGGVLTTGANSTYAIPGRYVALGPQDITRNVAAHEFGHILGFVDGYFRGYRERGAEGFEILEIVPDPDDIMSTPGSGRVQKHHFDILIANQRPAAAAPTGPRAAGEMKK